MRGRSTAGIDPAEVPALFLVLLADIARGGCRGAGGRWFPPDNLIPAAQTHEIDAATKRSVDAAALQGAIRDYLVRAVRAKTGIATAAVDDLGPESIDGDVAYGALKGRALDTVLEPAVVAFGFKSEGGQNPKYLSYMHTQVRLVRLADAKLLYFDLFRYTSEERDGDYWFADNATAVGREADRALEYLSTQIAMVLKPLE